MTSGRRQVAGARRAAAAVIIVTALTSGFFLTSTASAASLSRAMKPVKVVKVEMRTGFGNILTTKKSLALYVDNGAPCTSQGCLFIWPPLLMPKGKTMPGGLATGLGTTPFGSGQLQVTYDGKPLYTFYTDTKKTVSGQGMCDFDVVQNPT
jgi:predicted lipoprotein with Yx(FWY)xxD motif